MSGSKLAGQRWQVKANPDFWRTAKVLKDKYSHDEFANIIQEVRLAILELQDKGFVEEHGWNEHPLAKSPFADGRHFEFHIHDDDVLVLYLKLGGRHTIRMVGIYDYESLAGEK